MEVKHHPSPPAACFNATPCYPRSVQHGSFQSLSIISGKNYDGSDSSPLFRAPLVNKDSPWPQQLPRPKARISAPIAPTASHPALHYLERKIDAKCILVRRFKILQEPCVDSIPLAVLCSLPRFEFVHLLIEG
jgi:hypothetical protein